MAQDITLMGASYEDVPVVELPKTGGGTARFADASVTTATASDVASGKVFVASDGTVTTGTSSGGSVNVSDYMDVSTTGMDVVYEATNLTFDGSNYVDTNVALFSEDNIGKDFKVILYGLYADNNLGTDSKTQRCILGALYEVEPWPGILVRASPGVGCLAIAHGYKYAAMMIQRTNGVISADWLLNDVVYKRLSNTGSSQTANCAVGALGDMRRCTTAHDTTLTLGCEKQADGTPFRFCGGTIERVVIAMASE